MLSGKKKNTLTNNRGIELSANAENEDLTDQNKKYISGWRLGFEK